MAIECYFKECKHHSVHTEQDGPYCYEIKCLATKEESVVFQKARDEELKRVYGESKCPTQKPESTS